MKTLRRPPTYKRVIGRFILLAVLFFGASSTAYSIPACVGQTLDNYLVNDFQCTLGLDNWLLSDFEGNGGNLFPERIRVRPFGSPLRAGLQIEIFEDDNTVTFDDGAFFWLDFTIQKISGPGISSIVIDVPKAFAGPPNGSVLAGVDACPEALWVVTSQQPVTRVCPTNDVAFGYIFLPNLTDIRRLAIFDPAVFLIDMRHEIILHGGNEKPGGARLDGVELAFNTRTVPEPSALTLLTLGLMGLGIARRRAPRL